MNIIGRFGLSLALLAMFFYPTQASKEPIAMILIVGGLLAFVFLSDFD